MKLKDRVREARRALNLSQGELAEMVGVSTQSIGKIETGKTKKPENSWEKIADALRIPRDEFARLMDEQPSATITRIHAPLTIAPPASNIDRVVPLRDSPAWNRMIPVLGHVAGGAPGRGYIALGGTVEMVPCPPWLANVENAYALYVSGTSMVPRYLPGELVYVHPHKPVSAGDFVVAQIQEPNEPDPHGYVKQFVEWSNDGHLVLRQFQKPELIRFDADHVVDLHKIVVPGLT